MCHTQPGTWTETRFSSNTTISVCLKCSLSGLIWVWDAQQFSLTIRNKQMQHRETVGHVQIKYKGRIYWWETMINNCGQEHTLEAGESVSVNHQADFRVTQRVGKSQKDRQSLMCLTVFGALLNVPTWRHEAIRTLNQAKRKVLLHRPQLVHPSHPSSPLAQVQNWFFFLLFVFSRLIVVRF